MKFDDFPKNNCVFIKPIANKIAHLKKSVKKMHFLVTSHKNVKFLPVFSKITAYLGNQFKQNLRI